MLIMIRFAFMFLIFLLINLSKVSLSLGPHPHDNVDQNGEIRQRLILQVTIPKTVGVSIEKLIKADRPGLVILSGEECYTTKIDGRQDKFSFTFLRNPINHVYSQFLECKHDPVWGKRMTTGTTFPSTTSDSADFEKWLSHFTSDKNNKDNYRCYHPYNMMTRTLSDSCVKSEVNLKDPTPISTHYYLDLNGNDILSANKNLDTLAFVGIAEYFELSACLMMLKLGYKSFFKAECLRRSLDEVNTRFQVRGFVDTHSVPLHSSEDISKKALSLVDKLTKYDTQLYTHGIKIFVQEILEFERKNPLWNIRHLINDEEIIKMLQKR